MKFSIVAVVLPLIAGTSAAPSVVERQSPACVAYSGKFPHELVWGQWFLCCNYNGPDTTVSQDLVFNNDGFSKWRYVFTNDTTYRPTRTAATDRVRELEAASLDVLRLRAYAFGSCK